MVTQQQPMSGFRILDMTWWGVGPYCTFLCALMGAECLKIESATRGPEFMRRQARMHELNVNKLGVTLNLKHPKTLELVKRLVAVSDAVVENFSPGVLARLGLGYSELRKCNPSIVLASLSAHGATGPERNGKGLAAIFGAVGGASFITGYEDGPPVELRLSADLAAGTAFCYALLSALYYAKTRGQGLYIDGASREVMSATIGEVLMDAEVNHRDQRRQGNDRPSMAPHNVYRCAGEDRWVSIAVSCQDEWEALCEAIGKREWRTDPRFVDQTSRWLHKEDLDVLLSEWTRRQDAATAAETMQRRGVPATECCNARDLLGDAHLWERGLFVHTQDEDGGAYVMTGGPWRFSQTPWSITSRPPKMGEHNEHVLVDLLGIDRPSFEELVRQKALT